MAKLTDTLDTYFRSEVGEFLVETFGGIRLLRKNAADSSRWFVAFLSEVCIRRAELV